MDYAKSLSDLLHENGMRLSALAGELSLSSGLMSSYVRGEKTPNLKNAVLIADYFNVSLDYMTGRTDCPSVVQAADLDPAAERKTAPEVSEDGLEMLRLFEQLTERERILLLGQANGMLLARSVSAPAEGSGKKRVG